GKQRRSRGGRSRPPAAATDACEAPVRAACFVAVAGGASRRRCFRCRPFVLRVFPGEQREHAPSAAAADCFLASPTNAAAAAAAAAHAPEHQDTFSEKRTAV
ncbi:unnamed protein product, partial [Ectocarpus sp. 12 AP-2014]